ncbi:fumarate hydratase 1, mitochondrial-like [Gossypium australe]|uniref:Fumarate hydratase 1, mitochondrial-like n=1 Tax=Gossypium australe TaxID=47621 RepID=A0A5B6VMI9_9ROSI|nr:fumarate hydratase 1, mitochondrial-like [Gossypium australe]
MYCSILQLRPGDQFGQWALQQESNDAKAILIKYESQNDEISIFERFEPDHNELDYTVKKLISPSAFVKSKEMVATSSFKDKFLESIIASDVYSSAPLSDILQVLALSLTIKIFTWRLLPEINLGKSLD